MMSFQKYFDGEGKERVLHYKVNNLFYNIKKEVCTISFWGDLIFLFTTKGPAFELFSRNNEN